MINCSIGVMAYNEEANIGKLLEFLLNFKSSSINITEIIIVASGCTDNTAYIAKGFSERDNKIKLLLQEKREGKASAINLYLRETKSSLVVIVNADLLLKTDTIEKLVLPFTNPEIGMTGGHPIPLDSPENFMGFTVHLLWELHHNIALRFPKLGELIAYRNFDNFGFAYDTVADEGIIEAIMTQRGLKLLYVPEAIVNNVNPQKIGEFIRRRKNIFVGNLQLKKRMSYTASTINISCLLKIIPFAVFKKTGFNLKLILWSIIIAAVELWARISGAYDFYILKKDHSIWDIAKSGKRKLNC